MVLQVLHREEADHHRREEGRDHQLAPAVDAADAADLLPAGGCQAAAPRQTAAIR